jgi:clan AA aspartic protease (TIGR02281 family)
MSNPNDWYDPKNYRRSTNREYSWLSKPLHTGNPWIGLAFWSVIFAVVIYLASEYLDRKGMRRTADGKPAAVSLHPSVDCLPTELPGHGYIRVNDPSVMKRSDVQFSGLKFENRHTTPLTASISHGDKKVASILLQPGQTGELAAPVGTYGLELALGSVWCGGMRDFQDQRSVTVVDGVASQPGQSTSMLIETDQTTPAGVRLTNISKTPEPPQQVVQLSPGEIQINADRQGHFRIPGTVNGKAVTFMVDTGASTVAISRKIANEAGLYHCANFGTTSTANGQVDVCVVKNVQIEFGGIRAPGTDVIVMPNMADEVLLGMNVLKHMSMQQSDGRLRLTAR